MALGSVVCTSTSPSHGIQKHDSAMGNERECHVPCSRAVNLACLSVKTPSGKRLLGLRGCSKFRNHDTVTSLFGPRDSGKEIYPNRRSSKRVLRGATRSHSENTTCWKPEYSRHQKDSISSRRCKEFQSSGPPATRYFEGTKGFKTFPANAAGRGANPIKRRSMRCAALHTSTSTDVHRLQAMATHFSSFTHRTVSMPTADAHGPSSHASCPLRTTSCPALVESPPPAAASIFDEYFGARVSC